MEIRYSHLKLVSLLYRQCLFLEINLRFFCLFFSKMHQSEITLLRMQKQIQMAFGSYSISNDTPLNNLMFSMNIELSMPIK